MFSFLPALLLLLLNGTSTYERLVAHGVLPRAANEVCAGSNRGNLRAVLDATAAQADSGRGYVAAPESSADEAAESPDPVTADVAGPSEISRESIRDRDGPSPF